MAHCDPIERRRGRGCTRRGSRLCESAWSWRPWPAPSIATSASFGTAATSPTVWIPRLRSLEAVTAPTPHSRSTGRGWRNASSRSGGTTSRPSGFATPLATFARNFVRATPTVSGRPHRSRTSARSRAAICRGVPRMCREPAPVEERLVDRHRLDHRRRLVEHGEHRAARLGVRRHPRRHDDRVRTQRPRPAAAHRGAHTAGARLVARGQHHPAADDHGLPAQGGSSRCSTEA